VPLYSLHSSPPHPRPTLLPYSTLFRSTPAAPRPAARGTRPHHRPGAPAQADQSRAGGSGRNSPAARPRRCGRAECCSIGGRGSCQQCSYPTQWAGLFRAYESVQDDWRSLPRRLLAYADRSQRGQLTDRIADVSERPMRVRGREVLAPGGDLSGVAVAGQRLLDAGDVDGPVVQPRERLRRVDAQEAPVVGDRVSAQQEWAWV